jgi:antitoxin MazE
VLTGSFRKNSEAIVFVQVKKWGNSASVRIPAALMASSSLVLDQIVDMRAENGCLVIQPVTVPAYDLDEMLNKMTADTFHDDVEFGAPIGDEVW